MTYSEGIKDAQFDLDTLDELDAWLKAQTMLYSDNERGYRIGYYVTVSTALEPDTTE